MKIVSLEPGELDVYVGFVLKSEERLCGRVLSDPHALHLWAAKSSLGLNRICVAKDGGGKWLGAARWSLLGNTEAKLFPLAICEDIGDLDSVYLMLLGHVVHEILKNPEIKTLLSRPFVEQTNGLYNAALRQVGFKLLGSRVEFKSEVSTLPFDSFNVFRWQPITSHDELPFAAQVFRQAAAGDSGAMDVENDALGCLDQAMSEKGFANDIKGIQIGYLGKTPAAFVHVQVDKLTGWSRITYMGLVKEFRGKGLGPHVHRHAFSVIQEMGGNLYHGGTGAENKPMLALFEKHNCTLFCKMQEWQLDMVALRNQSHIFLLHSERLRLEPMRAHHAPACFELFQSEQIYPFIRRHKPTDLEIFSNGFAFLENRMSQDFSEYWWNWVCFDISRNQIVCTVEISFVKSSGDVYLAYTTFPAYWRMGFAKEACKIVIAEVLKHPLAKLVVIEMDTRNKSSAMGLVN